jgi:hypothetical protein
MRELMDLFDEHLTALATDGANEPLDAHATDRLSHTAQEERLIEQGTGPLMG